MDGICDVPIISNVCDTVGESAATLVAAPFDWLAQAIGQAASWLFQGVWSLFDSTTLVDITGAARTVSARYYLPFEAFITAAIFYLVLTFILVRLFKLAERRWLAYLAPRKH